MLFHFFLFDFTKQLYRGDKLVKYRNKQAILEVFLKVVTHKNPKYFGKNLHSEKRDLNMAYKTNNNFGKNLKNITHEN